MSLLDQQQPNAVESERAVLSSILVTEGKALARIPDLQPGHFFRLSHRIIFETALRLDGDFGRVDTVTLREQLRHRGDLERVGGLQFLDELLIPVRPATEEYAAAIVEAYKLRNIIASCNRAMQKALSNDPSVEIASGLQREIAVLGVPEEKQSVGIYDVVDGVHREADERAKAGKPAGVLIGFPSIDAQGGLPRKAGTVLGGPTSHGKTAFALNALDNAARMPEVRGAIYSLEMSRQAIADRLMARHARVPLGRIRNDWPNLSERERARVDQARKDLFSINRRFFFADRITSVSDLIADCRRRKASDGLDLVVVDYVQLLEGVEEKNRERTVNQIAWQLFEMARELDVAVLALSQVTPAAQMRAGGRLSIDDLRDSKAVGHHARVVLLVQRPRQSSKADTSIPRCKAVLQVEKHSEGDTGDVLLHFDGIFQEFSETLCDACGAGGEQNHRPRKSNAQRDLMGVEI
jgi:replicative DNA helicase